MDKKPISTRREFMKIGGMALAVIPLMVVGANGQAATNAGMRTSMKYQDKPEGDKSCSGCMQFVAGKKPTDNGTCKIFAGDTEISPHGYCIAWVAKPK